MNIDVREGSRAAGGTVPPRALSLTVNGAPASVLAEPRTSLADLLRDQLRLSGTHVSCEQGVCGACTVLLDDRPVRACITLAVACEGRSVRTIEGLDDDPRTAALREAFTREHALQCGFCTPGMLITARDIVGRLPGADETRVRHELAGNLCRCTGYAGIVRAVCAVVGDAGAAGACAAGGVAGPAATSQAVVEPPGAATSQAAAGPAAAASRAAVEPSAAARSHAAVEPSAAARSHAAFEPADGATSHVASTPAGAAEPGAASARPAAEAGVGAGVASPSDALPATIPGAARVTESVTVRGCDAARLWSLLGDVGAAVACLPGASVERFDGRELVGAVRVAFGPVRARFSGAGTVERDDAARAATVRGDGVDALSKTQARAVIGYRVSPGSEGSDSSRLDVTLEYAVQGPLAQFSRSDLVRALVGQMVRDFGANLEAMARGAPAPVAAPAGLGAFGLLRRWLAGVLARVLGRGR